jgi:hypothetical protein
MATVINTTFKLKRGTAARWAEVNPILEQGEPGFVYDSNRLKIGDGITPWNDLPYIEGKTEVANFEISSEFPTVGDPNIIYKAANELSLYQYNAETQLYEKLSDGKGIDNITIINGGIA